jgi:hypothetical protein
MALLSALKCPLVGSQSRTVSAAAKTVCKEYKKFCLNQVGGQSLNVEDWDAKSGSFSLKCFKDRPNTGYLIISAYQGLLEASCAEKLRAGFASRIEREIWHSIAESLLYGLGLKAEVVKEPVVKQTAKELRCLLLEGDSYLEAYLLSLLQSANVKTTAKVSEMHPKKLWTLHASS